MTENFLSTRWKLKERSIREEQSLASLAGLENPYVIYNVKHPLWAGSHKSNSKRMGITGKHCGSNEGKQDVLRARIVVN